MTDVTAICAQFAKQFAAEAAALEKRMNETRSELAKARAKHDAERVRLLELLANTEQSLMVHFTHAARDLREAIGR